MGDDDETNRLIDIELQAAIMDYAAEAIELARQAGAPEWRLKLRKELYEFRGLYVRYATHLVNQRRGDEKPVITLPA